MTFRPVRLCVATICTFITSIDERTYSTDLLHVCALLGQLQSEMRDDSTSFVKELTVYILSTPSPRLSTSSMQSLRICGILF